MSLSCTVSSRKQNQKITRTTNVLMWGYCHISLTLFALSNHVLIKKWGRWVNNQLVSWLHGNMWTFLTLTAGVVAVWCDHMWATKPFLSFQGISYHMTPCPFVFCPCCLKPYFTAICLLVTESHSLVLCCRPKNGRCFGLSVCTPQPRTQCHQTRCSLQHLQGTGIEYKRMLICIIPELRTGLIHKCKSICQTLNLV